MPEPKKTRTIWIAIATGLAYGLLLRLVLHWPLFGGMHEPVDSSWYPNDLWVMSFGFLVVGPIVTGWIASSAAATDDRYHWATWIFNPWIVILLCDLGLMIASIEGFICVIMAIPITLVCGSLGGIIGGLTARQKLRHQRRITFCLAVLPLLLCAAEAQFNAPLSLRTVDTEIRIHASAPVVWQNIKSVRTIQASEIRPNWTHTIGFPLPLAATLDRDGIGGIRHATFQGGLVFIETINQWVPNQRIAFTIAADTAAIPATTLDEHVTIGGRFFDVLDGEYDLHPLPNGDILLHLSSRQRLSTDFNAYAALWSDAVMRSLQTSILEVIKTRCESQPTP
jgi:hypothetical protein